MSTLGEKLKHELRELIPVTVFFFGTFRELVRALARERVTVMFFPAIDPARNAEREASQL